MKTKKTETFLQKRLNSLKKSLWITYSGSIIILFFLSGIGILITRFYNDINSDIWLYSYVSPIIGGVFISLLILSTIVYITIYLTYRNKLESQEDDIAFQ